MSAIFVCGLFVVACTSQRSTRMTVDDFDAMNAQLAASLQASVALRDRTGTSPPWVVVIDKVQNLSGDVMTDAEQWGIMARLRGSLPVNTLRGQKNIRFVLPPEQAAALAGERGSEDLAASGAARLAPTHTMTATFRSITRGDAEQSSELYYCEFQILDLADGQAVWSDKFEYKRVAQGHIWD